MVTPTIKLFMSYQKNTSRYVVIFTKLEMRWFLISHKILPIQYTDNLSARIYKITNINLHCRQLSTRFQIPYLYSTRMWNNVLILKAISYDEWNSLFHIRGLLLPNIWMLPMQIDFSLVYFHRKGEFWTDI